MFQNSHPEAVVRGKMYIMDWILLIKVVQGQVSLCDRMQLAC